LDNERARIRSEELKLLGPPTFEGFHEEFADVVEEKAKTLRTRNLDAVICHPFEFACAELVGQRLFIFGGLPQQHPGYKTMFVLNMRKMEWFTPELLGEYARSPRIGHTLTRVGRKFHIIGGYQKLKNSYLVEDREISHLVFDCIDMIWEPIHEHGTIPRDRMHHTTTKIGNTLYMLGGINSRTLAALDEFWSFDLESRTWAQLPQPFFGNIHAHAATKVGNKIVVFGGIVGSTISNEVFVYNAESKEWHKTVIKGLKPPARSHHTAVVVGRSLWALFGRDLGGLALDVFVLDLATLTWSYKVFDDSPGPREGQTAVRVGNSIVFVGGFTSQLKPGAFSHTKVEMREPHLVPLIVETGPRAVEIEHSTLRGDMIRLLESGLYADAKLKTLDDKVLHVHKAILHARSPLLREKLADEVITIGMLLQSCLLIPIRPSSEACRKVSQLCLFR
jgi:N-acetylneuraminic acid mutarotase